MDEESLKYFYAQLAKSIQAWLGVELEIYFLYALLMNGAHSHLISTSFYHIESFDSKLKLLDSCLKFYLAQDSQPWKDWCSLRTRASKLNLKRNKIVHEPVVISMRDGIENIIVQPSHFDARAIVKGRTSHNGPTINVEFEPSKAKLTDDHKINLEKMYTIEQSFRSLASDIRKYNAAHKAKLKRIKNVAD